MATPSAEQTAREFLRAAPRTRRSLEMMRVPSTGAPTGTPSREDARRSQELDPRLELELTQTRRTESMLLQKQLNDATSGGGWSLQVAIAPSALEPAAATAARERDIEIVVYWYSFSNPRTAGACACTPSCHLIATPVPAGFRHRARYGHAQSVAVDPSSVPVQPDCPHDLGIPLRPSPRRLPASP